MKTKTQKNEYKLKYNLIFDGHDYDDITTHQHGMISYIIAESPEEAFEKLDIKLNGDDDEDRDFCLHICNLEIVGIRKLTEKKLKHPRRFKKVSIKKIYSNPFV
jgi:hypothetical protein